MSQEIGRMCIYVEIDGDVCLISGVSDFTKYYILNIIGAIDKKVQAVKMSDLKFEELHRQGKVK